MAKIKPYPFQKEGVRDMEDFLTTPIEKDGEEIQAGGVLLADDMGLGKTLQALWLLMRSRPGEMFPALVVCPANVKYGWEYSAAANLDLRAQVLEGRTPPEGGLDAATLPKLTIINPDILSTWLPWLLKAGFKTLIMDESQYFSNLTSKRTKDAIELARTMKYRVALSGTPLMNHPGELWPTLHMIRPDIYRSFFSFAEDFCNPKYEFGKWKFKGAKNLDKLHALLRRTCMVRRLKTDVLDQLPKKNRVVVPMELSDSAEYQFAATDFVGWLRSNYRTDAGRVKRAARAQAVARVGYLVRLAARLKARSVVDWANRFFAEQPGEKLVLFGIHKKMIDVLRRRIKAKSVVVDGSVTGRNRKLAVDQFRKDPETGLFLGNMRAAGVGVDGLQDVCTNAAFAELWWVPATHTQAEDRIYRIGQTGVAWCHYLVSGGTIEEKLCRIIQTKQSTIHATLDGSEEAGDMDVFDLLITAMEEGNGD